MELREYQKEKANKATEIIKQFRMCYLSMEVRTGKTITALQVCKNLNAMKVIFITKKKAIKSVQSDAEHFNFDLTVINYESAFKFAGKYDIAVIDEAHSLGAFPKPSQRTIALKEFLFDTPIIFLSGTPTPESFSQLFHQFWISRYSPFINYPSFYKWAKDFVNVTKKKINGFDINDYTNANKELINKYTNHLFISYTQEQAGFDIKINEHVLSVKMDKAMGYIKNLVKNKLIKGQNTLILADTPVKMQSKVLQLCGGSVICEDGNSYVIDKSKAYFIQEYFEKQKIAIFYKFKGEFDILKSVFTNWTSDPTEFQQSDNMTFLGQFVSSREGIRLDSADAIVFYSIDFSYLSYEQAKNRILSKERQKEANLYWIQCENGIEAKVLTCVRNKKDYTNYYFKRDYGYRKQIASEN